MCNQDLVHFLMKAKILNFYLEYFKCKSAFQNFELNLFPKFVTFQLGGRIPSFNSQNV